MNLTAEQWKRIAQTLKPSFHLLKKDQVMYIPVGYILAERTTAGPMIYGSRKSFIIADSQAHVEYSKVVELCSKDGKGIERMQQVQQALKSALDPAKK